VVSLKVHRHELQFDSDAALRMHGDVNQVRPGGKVVVGVVAIVYRQTSARVEALVGWFLLGWLNRDGRLVEFVK